MEISNLDLICEQYNADDYPELDGEVRIPVGLDDSVLGIEEKSLRLIYSYKKAIDILMKEKTISYADAVLVLDEMIKALSEHKYRPIWSGFDGAFQQILNYSNDKYEVLRDKERCPTGLNDAAIGFDEESLRMIYSCGKAILALIKNDNMTYEDAYECLVFNTFGYSDVREYQPIWCDDLAIDNYWANEELN